MSNLLDIECHHTEHPNRYKYQGKHCTYTFPVRQGTPHAGERSGRFAPKINWDTFGSGNVSTWDHRNQSLGIVGPASRMQYEVTSYFELPLIAVVEQLNWPLPVNDKYFENISVWQHIGQDLVPEARQCYISWCAQRHETATVRGNFLSDVTSSITDLRFDPSRCGSVDPHLHGSDYVCPLRPAGGSDPSNSTPDLADTNGEAEDIYWVDPVASYGLGNCIQEVIGTRREGMASGYGLYYFQHSAVTNRIYQSNMSDILNQVAASLSGAIRNLNHTHTIFGMASQPVTHVAVNWYWLIFPTALVLLASLFLCVSVGHSANSTSVVWKTSILPLMLCGINEHEQRNNGASGLKDLEGIARLAQAQLVERNTGGPTLRFYSPHSGDG